MFNEMAQKVLARPLIARMSVIDSNGYPHTVPVWFKLDGDDVIITSVRKTAKIGYLQVNPKGCIEVGGDDLEGVGFMLKGTFSIEEDPDYAAMKVITNLYESGEQAEKDIALWSTWDMCLIRLKVEKVIRVI
jgi:nitroimidazol reductase NimA-like FMN-containing flavoprotein (pyridoxamine 5'-phosphate oxidase superfamily)